MFTPDALPDAVRRYCFLCFFLVVCLGPLCIFHGVAIASLSPSPLFRGIVRFPGDSGWLTFSITDARVHHNPFYAVHPYPEYRTPPLTPRGPTYGDDASSDRRVLTPLSPLDAHAHVVCLLSFLSSDRRRSCWDLSCTIIICCLSRSTSATAALAMQDRDSPPS